MDIKQSSEKRFALLIDADNVSAKYIKPITDELSKYGTVTYKRIYGDWTLTLHAKWKDALLENSITPIQQFGYTQGKNATDSAMIIDAMDILYTRSVEGFCIVSSDSDFTRLASRIRESGLTVIGMGEKKTPTPFRKACDIFTTLELLLGDTGGKSGGRNRNRHDQGSSSNGQGAGTTTMSKDEIEQAVVNIITDNQNNGKSRTCCRSCSTSSPACRSSRTAARWPWCWLRVRTLRRTLPRRQSRHPRPSRPTT